MSHIKLISVAEPKDPEGRITKFPYAFPIIVRELGKTNHSFDVIDTHLHKVSFEDLLKSVKKNESKVYGISAWSHQYLQVKYLIEEIKNHNKEAIVILGGIITGNEDVLLNNTLVDIISTGADGEFILPEILDALENGWNYLSEVKGIAYKNYEKSSVIKTGLRATQSKVDFQNQEWPDYEYFSKEVHELVEYINSYTDVPVKGFPILTARGCPFACTYCGHLYGSKFLRKNWDAWFDQVEHLINNYNVQGIYSHDTNLFLREAEVDEYCRIYKERNCNFKIVSELRPTFGDYNLYKKMYDHGVEVSTFGFESGSEEILRRMKRPMQKMDETRERLKQYMDTDMRVFGNFICGTPGESIKTLNETKVFMTEVVKWSLEQKIRLRKTNRLGTSGPSWTVFLPSPPSELYDLAVRDGLIRDEEAYLISLSDESNMQTLKGSKHKIALAREASHTVNMSTFSSKQALTYYVKYIWHYSHCFGNIFGCKETLKNRWIISKSFFEFNKYYILFLMTWMIDIIKGRKGYIPEEGAITKGNYLKKRDEFDAAGLDDKQNEDLEKEIRLQNDGI
jgi:radical SAM superfamily enzyme YgiQ (UPF0313 family)